MAETIIGNPFLRAALWYVRHGFAVFPLRPRSKIPATKHGFLDATVEERIVRSWWGGTSQNNLAIATGAISGCVVLDVDPRHNGDESLRLKIGQYGALPATAQAVTGGGGTHYLFQHPGEKCPCKKFDDGLEFKGDGGYIVVYPSIHPDTGRRYEWDGSDYAHDLENLAVLPVWLATLVARDLADSVDGGRVAIDPGGDIPTGRRNSMLTGWAGYLRRRGASERMILASIKETNEERCKPPLPDPELRKIAHSMMRYPPTGVASGTIQDLDDLPEWPAETPAPVISSPATPETPPDWVTADHPAEELAAAPDTPPEAPAPPEAERPPEAPAPPWAATPPETGSSPVPAVLTVSAASSVSHVNGTATPEKVHTILEWATTQLSIPVGGIVRTASEEPGYTLTLSGLRVEIADTVSLLNQHIIRVGLAARGGPVLRRFTPGAWERIIDRLLTVVEVVPFAPNDPESILLLMIDDYLSGTAFTGGSEEPRHDADNPFLWEDRVAVSMLAIRGFLNRKAPYLAWGMNHLRAYLHAVGANHVRTRRGWGARQWRWALPVNHFPPSRYLEAGKLIEGEGI